MCPSCELAEASSIGLVRRRACPPSRLRPPQALVDGRAEPSSHGLSTSARYEALFVVMSKPPGVPTAPVAEVAPVPNERAMLWNPRVT